jgi:two-component system, LytTR family, response regulator
MYRTIIVDDEIAQQELLQELLSTNFPEIHIMALCSSVEEALETIPKLKPDLVFLDVKMPPKTGFDLLRELDTIDFEVIFTSSFEHFAIQAFRVSALDYLLKPIRIDDMRDAISKLELRKNTSLQPLQIQNLLNNLQVSKSDSPRIALSSSTGLLFIKTSEVIRCTVERHMTLLFLENKSQIISTKTMKELDEVMTPLGFVRVHQSHLVNIKFVRKYFKGEGGQVEMEDGTVIEVSRRKKDELLAALSNF